MSYNVSQALRLSLNGSQKNRLFFLQSKPAIALLSYPYFRKRIRNVESDVLWYFSNAGFRLQSVNSYCSRNIDTAQNLSNLLSTSWTWCVSLVSIVRIGLWSFSWSIYYGKYATLTSWYSGSKIENVAYDTAEDLPNPGFPWGRLDLPTCPPKYRSGTTLLRALSILSGLGNRNCESSHMV